MLEFYTAATPTAKKTHICSLCGEEICIGEKYERFSGKADGIMFDVKHHLMCREIIYQYCQYWETDEYDNDSVIDWMQEILCGDCEHGWRDGEDDCEHSLFQCPKVIKRFSAT